MTMLSNPSGWAKRRQKAKRRHLSKNSAERAEIRAIRAEHARLEREAQENAAPAPNPDNAGPTRLADVTPQAPGPSSTSYEVKTFDLSGNWMQVRAAVRDELGLDKVPGSKSAAAKMLTDAGYLVEGSDGA